MTERRTPDSFLARIEDTVAAIVLLHSRKTPVQPVRVHLHPADHVAIGSPTTIAGASVVLDGTDRGTYHVDYAPVLTVNAVGGSA